MQSNPSSHQTQNSQIPVNKEHKNIFNISLAYIGSDFVDDIPPKIHDIYNLHVDLFPNFDEFVIFLRKSSLSDIPCIILVEVSDEEDGNYIVQKITSHPVMLGVILILLCKHPQVVSNNKDIKSLSNDIYYYPFDVVTIIERISFLIKFKLFTPRTGFLINQQQHIYRPPLLSRLFSFIVALFLIIFLSPIFLITALLIKLESKGPIFYKSKRAGTGYEIFDFYKFRSMVVDADKKLATLSKTNNQYGKNDDNAFVKILNDPRITKVGNFIRKTSIDELPQLFNVLKGDMMLVGNRPLPLYEAEMLTSDQFALRFLGPAGITGLWQISKRGKAEMSDLERKNLDNEYAKYSSFWGDIKIMLKTIPALLQKENV